MPITVEHKWYGLKEINPLSDCSCGGAVPTVCVPPDNRVFNASSLVKLFASLPNSDTARIAVCQRLVAEVGEERMTKFVGALLNELKACATAQTAAENPEEKARADAEGLDFTKIANLMAAAVSLGMMLTRWRASDNDVVFLDVAWPEPQYVIRPRAQFAKEALN
jgi:hypothetical protein